MQIKDYYKVLNVRSTASVQEIKTAYRSLAHQYHPDKNQGDPLAVMRFKEIAEAYSILRNTESRDSYDYQLSRWETSSNKLQTEKVTPPWLLNICRELNSSLQSMEQNNISFLALKTYILLILSDDNMDILLQDTDQATRDKIVSELNLATQKLKYIYTAEITDRLSKLAGNNTELAESIKKAAATSYKTNLIEKMQPYIIIIITLLLCLFMYVYSRMK